MLSWRIENILDRIVKDMPKYTPYELGSICTRLSSGKGIPAKQVLEEGTFPVYGGMGFVVMQITSKFQMGNVQ